MLIRNAAFEVVIELGDRAIVGGYLVTKAFNRGQRSRRRLVTEAVRVDSSYEVASSLTKQRLLLPVYVHGVTEEESRDRHRALVAAVEAQRWFLDETGDGDTAVWECDPADEAASPRLFPGNLERILTFSIPAHPAFGR